MARKFENWQREMGGGENLFFKKKKEGKEKRREKSNKEAGDTQVTLFSACWVSIKSSPKGVTWHIRKSRLLPTRFLSRKPTFSSTRNTKVALMWRKRIEFSFKLNGNSSWNARVRAKGKWQRWVIFNSNYLQN